ncbi:MAG: Lrp/AsnC ligand binding domain-containing protein [Elusimicrobiaceae bacterium]
MIAFIVCKLAASHESAALVKIKQIPCVKDVYLTFGAWDAVVIAEAPTMDKLSSLVVREVRNIEGVQNTETLITTNF